MFYKEISTRSLSKDFYCPNIVETPTYKTLNEIKDLFENFYTCVKTNNEINSIDIAKRIITKLETFEDYQFRTDIMNVLLDQNPTKILDIDILGYKDKKDVDNIKNLWFAKQTSFNAHLEDEIKRLSSKIESQSVAPPLLSISTFSRTFTTEEQKHLYDGLIKHGFISENTKRECFNFVFGGIDRPSSEKAFEPINWLSSQILLACLVRDVFNFNEKERKVWIKTKALFVINSNQVNTNTMKTGLSSIANSYDEQPEGYPLLKQIINT